MNNGLYYAKGKWDIGNADYHIYIVIGQRSRGKNAVWLYECAKRAVETGNKFIFLRRSDKQIELAVRRSNPFDPCYAVPDQRDFWARFPEYDVRDDRIFISGDAGTVHVGYARSLNNVKGASVSDCDVCLFDEFVEPARYMYKGGEGGTNEPELLARFLETMFRRREFWVIMLGNFDSATNPYNDYFRIPYNTDLYKNRNKSIWYERDVSAATADEKAGTTIGRIFGGTNYMKYSNGEACIGEVQSELIATRPKHAKPVFNVRIHGKNYVFYADDTADVEYIDGSSKYNPNLPLISVSHSDMCVDSSFLLYNRDFRFMQRVLYGQGRVRFDTQQTAQAYLTILSIV